MYILLKFWKKISNNDLKAKFIIKATCFNMYNIMSLKKSTFYKFF